MPYRISIDTGGTFTDAVIADSSGTFTIGKALTTPERIFAGMRDAIVAAARERDLTLDELLDDTGILIYGTTRATNAIVEGRVAKTAFLVTHGFPNVLLFREGGRANAFDWTQDFPDPYVPLHHTFEVVERIDAEGGIHNPLDRAQAQDVLDQVKRRQFEAIAVCFLWSVANPVHELAVGAMIEATLPDVPFTLSHKLLPIVREYRRASATAIDASLKPLMRNHLRDMEADLRAAGYRGRILVSTSVGGCMHVAELAERPIHSVKSGPAMAPVAGITYAQREKMADDVIVCDTGGTTFDVGLVRDGMLKYTRETWLGPQWQGHILGISAVDVRSIGAGGGSIAWVDPGGLLRVGPRSAGSNPGPASYGRGGTAPTVTDAAVVLGYLDPDFFLGGAMKLDVDAARRVVGTIARAYKMSVEQAADAIMKLASELMIKAIQDITIAQGFDPRESALVAGGGAAGLNIGPIARELGCTRVVVPRAAAALSACGMQFADIMSEASASRVTLSGAFDRDGVNNALQRIEDELRRFASTLGSAGRTAAIEWSVEARYRFQVWELDVALPIDRFRGERDVAKLVQAFHATHERIFAVRDPASQVECLNWKGRIRVSLPKGATHAKRAPPRPAGRPHGKRHAYFGTGRPIATPIYRGPDLEPGARIKGPAIVEEPTTTIVVYPGMRAMLSGAGSFILEVVR